jgi:hypothetical protein
MQAQPWLERSVLMASFPLLVAFVPGRSAPAQGVPRVAHGARLEKRASFVPVVFDGIVLGPDGSPALGAVVTSSAGGRTVTALDGSYRLEVQVPRDAERVQITATTEDWSGSQLVETCGTSRTVPRITPVDPLALTPGQGCPPRWLPTFGQPTMDATIRALAAFDDGTGPALFAGGHFTTAGGLTTNGIAKRDGEGWAALDGGLQGAGPFGQAPYALALSVFEDGGGPALFVGGKFTAAGGVPASSIARWDGEGWAALGSGLQGGDSTYGPNVRALAVFDDGSGPALFVGGDFTIAGGVAASTIAKWDGVSWTALGSGLQGSTYGPTVEALAVFDDGSGPALFVGGDFTIAGGVNASHIAKWDGSSWSSVGGGVTGTLVSSLRTFDDGSGPALYVGGFFSSAGGVSANHIAKWDGSTWSAVGGGMNQGVYALSAFDDGSGAALHAGGHFTVAGGVAASRIAKWDGVSWTAVGGGLNGKVEVLAPFDVGDGPALYAGGLFKVAGGVPAEFLARWDGTSWAGLGKGMNGSIHSLTAFDDGSGVALHTGGHMTLAGDLPVNKIAKWDAQDWTTLGSGISGPDASHNLAVSSMAVFDAGGGPSLYVGGRFANAGGLVVNHVAKWNGSTWSSIGGVTAPPLEEAGVNALAVYDDGSGPALYVGGDFTHAGGVPANHIARWNGSAWSPLAGGMNGPVNAMAVFDDGSGPVLVCGGMGAPHYIAQWNGSSWSPMHGGMNFYVQALAVFDDGAGAKLHAGGWFNVAGGVAVNQIARWDGSTWSAVGSGMNDVVYALSVFDDGGGPALYAGGAFTTAGGLAAQRIARWDGSSWSALGSGMNGDVRALTVFDDGNGQDLYAAGLFGRAFDSGDSFIARWGCALVTRESGTRQR